MSAETADQLGTIAVHQIGGLWYFGEDLARRPDLRERDTGTGASHVIRLPDNCTLHVWPSMLANGGIPMRLLNVPGWGNVTAGRLVEMAEQGIAGIAIAATIM